MKGKTKSFTDLALTTAKTSALRTMKRCVTLIREAIAAEFPSFDAVMAFSIFNLSSDPSPQRHGGFTPLRKQDGLKRLSNLFELDELALSHEFQKMHNIAEAHFKQAGCSNRDAWRWAYRRACHNRSKAQTWKLPNLDIVTWLCLLAYIFWLGRGLFFSMTFQDRAVSGTCCLHGVVRQHILGRANFFQN
jgi:hypothetical protein